MYVLLSAGSANNQEGGHCVWAHKENGKEKDVRWTQFKTAQQRKRGTDILKGNAKRIISGLLSAATVLSAFLQPIAAYAAEPEPAAYEAEYPALDKVRTELVEDEVVFAKDYETEAGSGFDVEHDFSGIKFSAGKVKVTFHEAKNKDGKKYDNSRADTYRAVYFVEPASKNPAYHISRNITVKEKASASSSETQTAEGTESGNGSSGSPDDTQDGDAADVDRAELTVDSVLMQAGEQGIDLAAMEAGESVTFYASSGARSMEQVTVTRGDRYNYADYGYGSYLTYKYTVQFGDVSATAYCIQPSVNSPGSGVYTISKLKDKKALAKVCYYGTKASGDEGFFAEKHPDFSEGQRFIITHMAASNANGSDDAFSGANDTGKALAMELYNYCMG